MLRPQEDIYLTLPIHVARVPGNKPSNYKTVLPTPLKLNGACEVALLEAHDPQDIANFKATTLFLIATETPENDQPKSQPNLPQASQSAMPQPQTYQAPRGHAHRDEIDGFWPAGEDDEYLHQNDQTPSNAPQPLTAAESTQAKWNPMKWEQQIDMDDGEPSNTQRPPDETPDVKKPEHEMKKKTDEDVAKKEKEDVDKKKSDEEAAQKKSETDAAAKKEEAKRQEDLNNHMTQPLFMFTQA